MSRPFSWQALIEAAQDGSMRPIRFDASPAYVADVVGTGGYVYLATPYSKRVTDSMARWSLGLSGALAAEAAVQAGLLKDVGVTAFSPIVMSAAICHATLNPYQTRAEPAPRHDPMDTEAWLAWCLPMLQGARAVVVPDILGWDQSEGIKFEVMAAIEAGKPVIVYAKGGYDGA